MIDLNKARELLPQAVATQGEDFIYSPDGIGACYYTPRSTAYRGDDDPKVKTGCLVGVVLVLAGIPVEQIGMFEGSDALTISGERPDLLANDAGRYLRHAQSVQDQGGTWGAALNAAEEWYAAEGR